MLGKDTGLYLELEALGNFARNTAASMSVKGYISGGKIANASLKTLRRLKRKLSNIPAGTAEASEAAEWFSDNWYIAEREGKDGAEIMKRAGSFSAAEGSERRAVASEAAAALIRSGRGQVTQERIGVFLEEYQKVSDLTQRELSVFTAFLKLELVSFLDSVLPEKWQIQDSEVQGELTELLKNVFTSLRLISQIDLSDLLEKVNKVEKALRDDPAGIYPMMDDDTRHDYRRTLAKAAEKAGISEYEAARTIVGMCTQGPERHVGYYIFTKPLGKEKGTASGTSYIAAITLISAFLTLLIGFWLRTVLISILLLIPISEIVKNIVDYVCLRIKKPARLPRIDLERGIPKSGRTICVISALLTDERSGERFAHLLEEYSITNRDPCGNLLFGILADLCESGMERERGDAVILEQAVKAVGKLNEKYGGGFFLLFRDREYNESSGRYMGKERKRGAVSELVKLLSGQESTLSVLSGDERELNGVNFILTLDSDTRLTAGSAMEMIGAALHPLNTPQIDEKKGRVVRGYGIFEPRVSVDLQAAGRSDFTRIFAGQGGIDPYNSVVSDVYQDLFGEGTFMGKGLINVPVYARLLEDTFPENQVLSHDILEGAYMRCAYLSDTELTDGYPYKVTSYFARQERWTRGDWQNIRWMTRRVKNRDGALVINNIGDINKWKIFDNLRRSLVPVMIFTALMAGMLISGSGVLISAAIAVAAQMTGLLLTSADIIIHHDGRTKARYQSAIISGIAGGMMQTIIRLMLLPAEAWNQFKAIAQAVYRMMISHKNMLNWVTSSEAERRHGNTIAVNYLKLAACPIAGILAAVFSPYAAAAAVGLVWIVTPAYAWALSREIRRSREISQSDRGFLMACASDIWKYFSQNLTEKDNYLPPDNIQEEPAIGPARRTSPTNIGLAMLSVLSASDLGLVSSGEAYSLIGKMLDTVERLEKWNGHLYNWYETAGASPMEPRYVSTVDSGNLAGSLIVLKQALIDAGETGMAERCEKLADAMDFRPLFDKKRKLFYIGYDIQKAAPTEGWYDLLSSEARETSFIAIATGQVPRKHWRRLSRALVSQDNFSGMVSWTGTMFEYLMPNLVLPCYPDSLLYESSRFCIYAQRKAHPGMPWGISESAYYAFDPGLSYKYKAHGVQRLALKRKMDQEIVVSPYSTFLALSLEPRGAVKNLRRLASLGAVGKYGFYEALDYTPSRQGGSGFEIVRTYMAHHLGMSIAAIANLLCGDIMPKRFMSDIRMAAYSELLEERVPSGEIVLRQPPREVPEKPSRREGMGYKERSDNVDSFAPKCLPLSNGSYSLLIAENGKSRSTWGNIELTRFDTDPYNGSGVEFYLKTPGGYIPLQPAPAYSDKAAYAWEFSDGAGSILTRANGVSACVTSTVPAGGDGEIRTVELIPDGRPEGEYELICRIEPVLQRAADYKSHPSFSKLSLEAAKYDGMIVVHRRPKDGNSHIYMTLASDGQMRCITQRQRGDRLDVGEFKETSPEMELISVVPVNFKDGRCTVRFAIVPGETKEESVTGAKRLLNNGCDQTISRIGASALMLGMNTSQVRAALGHITGLVFTKSGSPRRHQLLRDGGWKKEDLWKWGISGDIPLMTVRIETHEDIDRTCELVREHAFLAENGVRSDLAIITADGGDYRSSQRRAITELLRRLGRENTLGIPGGVTLVDSGEENALAVEAMCDLLLIERGNIENSRDVKLPPKIAYERGSTPMSYKIGQDGAFYMAMSDTLPPLAWSHVLSSKNYGFLATEAGTGYMWYKNSREMKINRWLCDPLTTVGTEALELVTDSGCFSLFASGDGWPTVVEYGFGYAVWRREIQGIKTNVTAFVPEDIDARVLVIKLDGNLDGCKIRYFTELTLGGDNELNRNISTWHDKDALCARNEAGEYRNTVFRVSASAALEKVYLSKEEYLLNREKSDSVCGTTPGLGMLLRPESNIVLVTGCADDEEIRRLHSIDESQRILDLTKQAWRERVMPASIETGHSQIDGYINGWALYQTIACRLYARTALYQNGGAVGFRDQLQDACAIMATEPELAASVIKEAAGRQYLEGDVQHWWHRGPEGARGVRTRCSDDLLWLPYALCEYVKVTGDHGLCRTIAGYISSPPLRDGEWDRYERPERPIERETLLQHAMRAADMFIKRGTGEHGLALIGSGDWNDGMDKVGEAGRGESVWLTQFGSLVLARLGKLCSREGEAQAALRYEGVSRQLLEKVEAAWTGDWYLRGRFDDGSTLGGPEDKECQIDSISQSFAVFAGADRERTHRALISAWSRLYDREHRIVKLFDPPFDAGARDPGYIKGYAPGYRENGGQYTHGAIWLAIAMLRQGELEKGAQLLEALSPAGRDEGIYRAEPYVIAADVYSASGHEGRGGWTWYTGSAGWYFRAVTEELLGLHARDGRLFIEPRLPEGFGTCRIRYHAAENELDIVIKPTGFECEIQVNGLEYDGNGYPLKIHNKFISTTGNV